MPVPTTTLQVAFVSESADFRNTFGWYNRATGYGGILFANVEAQGGNAPLTPGVSTANFTVNTADLANIAFFLVSDGYDLNRNDADDFTGAVKVIQLANGTWAVADVDSHGNVKTDHGAPDILKGEGVNALFTETSKNAGHVDYASAVVGSSQTAATLTGDTANGSYTKPGDADYNDAVFRISIVGGNHAPTANADTISVGEDSGATAINVLGNDTDPDAGNALHITSIATSGVVGTVAIAPGGSGLTYTPPAAFQALAAGETATETFSYTAADQDGASSSANVTVTVVGANDAPLVAGALSAAGSEGSGGFTVNLLAGASDIDHGAVLHVANLTWTDTGSGLPAGFTAAGNALTVDTSNAAYNAMAQGETFTTHFAYDVVDEHGASVHQTATVAITGANDAPVITGGDTTGSVQENTVNQATGQLDAFDPDHGAVLSWTVQGGSASGSADYRFSADSFSVIRSGLLPTVTIAPPPGPVTEGGALAFTLTRTGDLSQALTVNLNTTFAGANNFDISAPSTAGFAPGAATTVVNVQALDDTFVEGEPGLRAQHHARPGLRLGGRVQRVRHHPRRRCRSAHDPAGAGAHDHHCRHRRRRHRGDRWSGFHLYLHPHRRSVAGAERQLLDHRQSAQHHQPGGHRHPRDAVRDVRARQRHRHVELRCGR